MLFHASWFARVPASAAWLLLAVLLAATALPALRAAHRYRSAAAVAVVLLAAAWSLNAAPDNGQLAGMSYHLLGMNLAALMVGAPAALWLGALLLFPSLLISDAGWQAYPFNALALLLPPLAVNLSFRVLVGRLPANIFVFIFLNGFIGSAAAMLLTGAVLTGVLDRTGAFSDGVMWGSAFPVFFLLSWAEAFISGAATAIFVALKPHWINTFDDGRYLKSTNKIW